jgi:hypothetical protein
MFIPDPKISASRIRIRNIFFILEPGFYIKEGCKIKPTFFMLFTVSGASLKHAEETIEQNYILKFVS